MKVLWICGLPEEVRAVHPVTDVPSAAWSWIVGHLPPPKDVELHILCPVFDMKEKECHFEHDGAHWHCFRLKRFEPIFLRYRFYLGIRKFVKGLNPDVIHGWGGESGCGLLATYCSPYAVVGVQGLLRMLDANARRWEVEIPERGSVSAWIRRKLEMFAYHRANRLVVEGEASQASLMALYGLPSRIVPHPLRREFLTDDSDSRKKANGEVRFLFVGQLTARKGAMDVACAFAELGDVHARLTIVGSGEQGGLIDDFVARRGLQGRVERKTVCSADGLREMMDASDVIVVPSYGDTGPTVLKEALARGLYPIVYGNTGAQELVGRYGIGSIVPTGEVPALRNAMRLVSSGQFDSSFKQRFDVALKIRDDLSANRVWDILKGVYGS